MTQPLTRPSVRDLRAAGLAATFALALASGLAVAADPLLDDPIATTRVPDGVTTITQTREQNAVTSVQVRRGGNVYHVTPAEQIPANQGGRPRGDLGSVPVQIHADRQKTGHTAFAALNSTADSTKAIGFIQGSRR